MSGLPFELLLALRYLRPKRTFVSVITLISVFGVALGVAVLIIVISVMSGFDEQMRETILGFNTHLHVYERSRSLTNYPALIDQIKANPNVKGVAPQATGPVLVEVQFREGEAEYWAPQVRGIDPDLEAGVSTLPRSIVPGQGKFDVGGHGVLIGSVFAERMHLNVGDRINVYSPHELKKLRESRDKKDAEQPVPIDYDVRGIFDVGYFEYNAAYIAVSLQNAQEMFDLGDDVQSVIVMLHDPLKAASVKSELEESLGSRYEIRTWLQESSLLSAVLVEKKVMLYILFFIVIVAAFGITCTLITFVVMKTRDIGVLKAVGASNRQVMWVFMAQSLVVSIFGIALGLVGGILLVTYRNEFLEFMRLTTGWQLFPAEVYGFNQLPAKIIAGDIAIICGGSLLICLAAAAFPARFASRMNPVEALRYE